MGEVGWLWPTTSVDLRVTLEVSEPKEGNERERSGYIGRVSLEAG